MHGRTFLTETKQSISESGHKPSDVMFIGSSDGLYRMSWSKFVELADFEYERGYGSSKIATDLIVYFTDKTYMVRGEYDGSEWWEYSEPLNFAPDDSCKEFNTLGGDTHMWETVDEMINLEQEDTSDGEQDKVKSY